jgi:PAS domain S-box-containing protein
LVQGRRESLQPKVLVIDDDAEIRGVLVELLDGRGYEAKSANSGEEGLSLVAESAPNVVILDIHLPDTVGTGLLPRIAALSPDIEVILISGDATLDSAIEGLRKHAYDYITKPFKFSQLLSSLEGAMEHQRLQVENRRMVDQLKFLNNLVVQVSRATELDGTLKQLLQLSMTHFRAESGAVYLKVQDAWKLRQHSGVSRKVLDDLSVLPASHPLAKEAERGVVSFANAGNGNGPSSWASVPLIHDDKPIGIIILTAKSGKTFAEEDRRLMTIVGTQAGAAMMRSSSLAEGEERRQFLEGMIDSSNDAVITYSLDGSVTGWNLAATRLYGFGEREALGRHLLLIPDEERENVKDVMARIAIGEQVQTLNETRLRRNGQPVEVEVAYSPIRDGGGRVLAIASFSHERRNGNAKAPTVPTGRSPEDRLREVLVGLVPTIMTPVGEDGPARMPPLPANVAKELRELYIGGEGKATPERAAEAIAKLFADLGGKFEGRATNREIVLSGKVCPWGNGTRHAPAACALTKALALTLAQGAWSDARVVLLESLANNDERCLVLIRGSLTGPKRED